MSSLPARVHLARSIPHGALLIPLLLTCFWRPGISATIDSQDFGQHSIGELSSQSIAVPVVTPGPATFSLQYSLDFTLGPCTPSANGCFLSITFGPIKPGLRQDAVIVKDASGRVVEEILLHGVGLGPLPVFSPAVATFKGPLIPPPSGGPPNVQGIAAVPDGKILILAGNTIYRFDNATGDLTAIPGLPPPASDPLPSFYGLATDAA